MKRFSGAVLLAVCLLGPGVAHSYGQEKPKSTDSANPFPEDITNVPVMPSTPGALAEPDPGDAGVTSDLLHLPAIDIDPIRSPDDVPVAEEEHTAGESSSSSSLDKILGSAGDDNDPKDRKHHHDRPDKPQKQKTKKDFAAEDLEVGSYYLEKKNWKAAQSRFQSAMVLDPENPEVYWGLAESAYHMGDLYTAREYYIKLADYDPEGPHGKQLKKILKDPALLNAKPLPAAPAAGNEKPKE